MDGVFVNEAVIFVVGVGGGEIVAVSVLFNEPLFVAAFETLGVGGGVLVAEIVLVVKLVGVALELCDSVFRRVREFVEVCCCETDGEPMLLREGVGGGVIVVLAEGSTLREGDVESVLVGRQTRAVGRNLPKLNERRSLM